MTRKRFIAAALAFFFVAVTAVTAARGIRYYARVREAAAAREFTGLTLIIDAGHGGVDGGAVSVNGTVESGINLDIALKAELLAAFFGVRTVMTRDSEAIAYSPGAATIREKKNDDTQRRIRLINDTPNAVLLSIHQNQYTSPEPSGAQAMYARTRGSEEWALVTQELLVSALDASNRRPAIAVASNILIMNRISCPALLVECGFLSNGREEALLNTDEYRLKIAVTLTAGFLRGRETLEAVYTANA